MSRMRFAIDIAPLGELSDPRASLSPMRGSVDELEAIVRRGPPLG